MIKKFFAQFICLAFFFNGYAYNIDLRINGIRDSQVILARYYGDLTQIVDSTMMDHEGYAVFHKDVELTNGIYMFIFPQNKYFETLISNDTEFSVKSDTSDLFFKLEIYGADESASFLELQKNVIKKQKLLSLLGKALQTIENNDKRRDDILKKMDGLNTEIDNLNNLFLIENQGTFASKVVKSTMPVKVPDFKTGIDEGKRDSMSWVLSLNYFKLHYFDNIDLQDDRLLYTPVIKGRLDDYFNKVIYQQQDSITAAINKIYGLLKKNSQMEKYVTGYLFYNFNKPQKQVYEDVLLYLYNNYVNIIKNDIRKNRLLDEIEEKTKFIKNITVGSIAPDLVMVSSNGAMSALSEIKSEYTILIFWDPDCNHCEEEINKLVQLYNENRGSMQVFAVYIGKDENKWKKTIDEKGLDWINVYDPEEKTNFMEVYQVSYTPKIILLDNNKKILVKTGRIYDVDRVLDF